MVKSIHEFDSGHPMRLDRWINAEFPALKREVIFKAIRTGDIKIEGKKQKPEYRLQSGDIIEYPPFWDKLEKRIIKQVDQYHIKAFENSIICDDMYFVAINKPTGLAVQGGTGQHIAIDHIAKTINPEYRLVHRLDKDTSGVLIIAKNREYANYLIDDFKQRDVKKTYHAIVQGKINRSKGVIKQPLFNTGENMIVSPAGLSSETRYERLQVIDDRSWLSITPITGRKHQIRAHFSHVGCPVVGDYKYGFTGKSPRLFLHAHELYIRGVKIIAPLPNEFEF